MRTIMGLEPETTYEVYGLLHGTLNNKDAEPELLFTLDVYKRQARANTECALESALARLRVKGLLLLYIVLGTSDGHTLGGRCV